jgi:hypothetical protein
MFRGAATHAVTHQVYNRGHPSGTPRVGCSDIRQSVSEGSPLTFPVSALPPAQGELNVHHLPLNRKVLKSALAPTVPMTTSHTAIRTRSDWLRDRGNGPFAVVLE